MANRAFISYQLLLAGLGLAVVGAVLLVATLLDLLVGWKKPSSRTISLNGQSLQSYERRQLARQIALVPQDFAISFACTVEEVVFMGRHPYINRFSNPSVKIGRP